MALSEVTNKLIHIKCGFLDDYHNNPSRAIYEAKDKGSNSEGERRDEVYFTGGAVNEKICQQRVFYKGLEQVKNE